MLINHGNSFTITVHLGKLNSVMASNYVSSADKSMIFESIGRNYTPSKVLL